MFVIGFFVVTTASIGSYIMFSEYKPKALVQVQEVRGAKSDKSNSLDLPYPEKSLNISITQTDGAEQISFKTTKTKDDVKQYYKNVLNTLGWKLDAESNYDDYTTAKFQKGDQKVSVMAFEENDSDKGTKSLVGLEIKHN